MQKLVVSKYLQIVPRKIDYAIYHSLFGNLELIDYEGKKLLDAFKTSNSIDKVVDLFDKYESSALLYYINDLQRRNFLVQDGINEYELIEEDYNRRKQYLQSGYLIRALQLIVTNKCNFSCEYCFVNSMYDSKERIELQHRPTNMKMSIDIAKQSVSNLLDLLERNGNRYLNIEFFGGEPLLNWPVIKFILETFKNGNSNKVRIIYSITTNGYLITDKMARLFKNYGVTVTVSFDSLHKTNRPIIKNEKGGERVKRNLEILKKNGNYVTFNSVLSKETLDEYDAKTLVDIAKYYNIAMIGLILDLNLEFYENETKKEKILTELWSTYQYGQSQGIPIVGYWHQIFNQIIGKQPVNILSGYKTCPATGCKLSVEPEGHVFICKCCSGYIGHISNLGRVICSPQYEAYAMRAYRNAPECDGCEIEGFCSGVCMGSLEKKYHRLAAIEKSSCDVFKGITKKLIQNVSSEEVDVNYLSELSGNIMQT
jgi:uncharacterized protein